MHHPRLRMCSGQTNEAIPGQTVACTSMKPANPKSQDTPSTQPATAKRLRALAGRTRESIRRCEIYTQ
ncbi:hypothetical protein BVRB_011860 [Beta vulgaris subsp. vulgaris]|uniref:Uncharacterized protein n=1 Tax=Beta vulgaris subsp. vulgaris TaxID=3555 RepID=A0A0J8B5H9_BETVV|nr:hypothetical protein BVRB_011860 [Beta vulgaris subsp. vulgaris]